MPRAAPLPCFRVHGLAQAEAVLGAAVAARRRVGLVLGVYLGWAACAALRDQAQAAVPGARADWLFDPGGRAAAAALALRQGAPAVLWPAADRRRPALALLARQTGARLLAPPAALLDLAQAADPLAAARDHLLAARAARAALPRERRRR